MVVATLARSTQGDGRDVDTHIATVMEAEGVFLQGSLGRCGRELGAHPPPRKTAWRGEISTVGREKQQLGGGIGLAPAPRRSRVEKEQRCSEMLREAHALPCCSSLKPETSQGEEIPRWMKVGALRLP